MTEEFMRSLYLDALRTCETEACKKIVTKIRCPRKTTDRETLFDRPEYAKLLREELLDNAMYQAAISEDPFSNPELLSEYKAIQPRMEEYLSDGVLDLARYRKDKMDQEMQEYKAEADKLLETVSISETILSNLDRYLVLAEEKICTFLTQDELFVYYHKTESRRKYAWSLDPVNMENMGEFFLRMENRRFFPNFFLYVVREKSFSDFIARQIYDAYPILEKAQNIKLSKGYRPCKKIDGTAHKVEHDFFERLFALFPLKRIKELVHRNPRYTNMMDLIEQAEQKRRMLNTAMLDSIPEQYKDFYPAARAMHRDFILHIGPTNSGKTYDAINALMEAGNGIYLAPLRLLAYEQYEKINRAGIPCSLLTGEEQELVGYAKIQSSTIEMADLNRYYDVAVIDEAQMIADSDRGGSWTNCILGLCAKEIHVCASRNAEELLKKIIEDCGDSVTVIHHERQTPLMFESKPVEFPKDVRPGDALIVFSKRDVHAVSAELQKKGRKCSIIYGALPYDVRHKQAELFASGENEIVVATDAIGMGMNLPIKRVVFLDTTKFDGVERRSLTSSEIKQIGGRAGRFGVYPKGFVATAEYPGFIQHGLTVKDTPITQATVEFPESLIGLNAPLIDILERWDELEPHTGWNKAATGRMLFLAKRIYNAYSDAKNDFCYNFVTLPFDESDQSLLSVWDLMVRCEYKGKHFDVLKTLPEIPDADKCRMKNLDTLEFNYRLCDLLYNYVRHFLPEESDLFNAMNQCKYRISSGIMHILSTQKLSGRHCEICNRPLPWNSRYKTCYSCYEKQQALYHPRSSRWWY
ncbi:MAG: hypothetical protein J6B53_09895 [Clostridia bacterium]|nr:hypothetical protein [Clostridia bacterium]